MGELAVQNVPIRSLMIALCHIYLLTLAEGKAIRFKFSASNTSESSLEVMSDPKSFVLVFLFF